MGTNNRICGYLISSEVFDDEKSQPCSKRAPAVIEEDVFIFRRNGRQVPPDGIEVKVDEKHGSAATGYESFLCCFCQ